MRTGRGKAGLSRIRRFLAQRWLMKTSLNYWDIIHTHTHTIMAKPLVKKTILVYLDITQLNYVLFIDTVIIHLNSFVDDVFETKGV